MQLLKSVYKVGRWVLLAVLIATGVLMLRRPQPAAAELAPALQAEKAKEFEQSLAKLEKSDQNGDPGSTATEARFDTDQVNSFIAVASAEAAKQSAAGAQNAGAGTGTVTQNAGADAGQYSAVSSSKVAFREDEVTAQAVTQRYGRDIYVTVRGHIGSKDGYVTFEPTEFSVGSLSVPVALVNPTLQKMLRQPEVRDRLKLPEFISDLRVENSQLVIVRK